MQSAHVKKQCDRLCACRTEWRSGGRPAGAAIISLLLWCAALASGCTVGPNYRKPEIAPPQRFESQEVLGRLIEEAGSRGRMPAAGSGAESASPEESAETLLPVPADWWRGFDDAVLGSLVDTALAENPEIAAAAARVEEAAARLDRASTGDALTSTFDADAEVDNEKELDSSRSSETNRGIFGVLSLALPLDLFGRTKRAEEAASAELEAAIAALRAARLRVSAEAAAEYLQLRGDQQQLALLRESVALQEKTLQIVQSRFESGLSPELDLRRAEAAVETLRADISPLEESLTRSRHRLSTLTGDFHAVGPSILDAPPQIPRYQANVPDLLPLEVLRLRPDVQQAEAELKRSIAAIGVAEAEWYPLLTLFGRVGIGRSGLSGEPAVSVLISSIAAAVQQTITDGGLRRADIEIAEAQAEAALARYRRTLLEAVEEVEGLLAGLESSLARQRSLSKAVTASERSFFQAETLYRQGLTSFLDVVDAQRVLASAQQQLASAQTRYASQVANLFRVLGAQETAK